MPRPRKQPEKIQAQFFKWFPIIFIVASAFLTTLAGIVGWTSWITSNVAQISYVDDLSSKHLKYIDIKIAETIKYTDEKIINLRKESFDHSDINKGQMETEYKGLSAKLDMLIMMVQQSNSKGK